MNIVLLIMLWVIIWVIIGYFFASRFLNPESPLIQKGSVIVLWPVIFFIIVAIVAVVLFVHFLGFLF
jgi:membrane protein DedA with SNARE-associated domain